MSTHITITQGSHVQFDDGSVSRTGPLFDHRIHEVLLIHGKTAGIKPLPLSDTEGGQIAYLEDLKELTS